MNFVHTLFSLKLNKLFQYQLATFKVSNIC